MSRKLTIGALSRRTGVSVKTLRFYSDEGLLPPAGRTRSGYRLYDEAQVVRIDLIRTLRDAGIGLETIARVLDRELTIEEALRIRLRTIEAHVTSLTRVAGAIRAALRSRASSDAPDIREEDLRRLSMVTKLSFEERKRAIERFYTKVMEGAPVPAEWIDHMVATSTPELPDEPSAEQLDAWIELASMLDDPEFVAAMRVNAASFWAQDVDVAALRAIQSEIVRAASDARARGVDPRSDEARALVRGYVARTAAASGDADEATMLARLRAQYDRRAERYWELVAIMGGAQPSDGFADQQWLGEATRGVLLER
ncbi:MerR family transcriptional regulator [Sandaracinus amylolyticus]|uniref:Transcriptional regulator, MerR family protein n=1 Tax=Sandaracinus amylolyticus TaxID=927083 RepID=A0A0F6W0X7_9BACT|nr:MerR family transcriptional regulator [Sandaracinus amylolyticus]AKF04623.1 Transcriptional regulator, MerR family protein [Sandaracinus amylolyticus]